MRELSLNVMDVAQNSITAGATLITISLEESTAAGELVIGIDDNGCGMNEEQLRQVQSPFYSTRKTRSIGLGVPLFKMACEMTGGSFSIESAQDIGTKVRARFMTGHIDMIPVGDMAETIILLVSCNPSIDFVYKRVRDAKEAVMDTRELREVLGDEVSLAAPEVVQWLRGYLMEQLEEIGARQ